MSKWKPIKDPLERIQRMGWTVNDKGCWNYNGSKNPKGYPVLSSLSQDLGTYLVHRAMYIIKNGEIDQKMEVMHSCDNRGCINLDHLSLGTHDENMLDMSLKMRMPRPKLNPEKVLEIRKRLADGLSNETIGRMYGVSRASIRQIKRNKTWKWVTNDMEESKNE